MGTKSLSATEAQLHAWHLLRHIVSTGGGPLRAAVTEMNRRWTRLRAIEVCGTKMQEMAYNERMRDDADIIWHLTTCLMTRARISWL